jgi:hypothetical protein
MNTPQWNERIKALADSVRGKPVIKKTPDKVAVIIEPRVTQVLPELLAWMIHLLSPYGWKFVVYCGTLNEHLLKDLDVEVRQLGKDNLTRDDYNIMLYSEDFWLSMPFENILIFQTDAVLIDGNLDEFLNYDYVGAPWNKNQHWRVDGPITVVNSRKGITHRAPTYHLTGNGGLSLRKRSAMIRGLRNVNFRRTNEDYFFSVHCRQFINISPPEIAMRFAVETVFCPDTVGFHACWKHLSKDEMSWIYSRLESVANS